MATQSLFYGVKMKSRKMSKAFIDALENAKGKNSKKVVLSKSCKTIKEDSILKLFGEDDERI